MAFKVATPFMNRLFERLKTEKGVSESTAKQYIQTLFKMNGNAPFKSMTWAKDTTAVEASLSDIASNTKGTYYRVLASVLLMMPTYKKQSKYFDKLGKELSVRPSSEKTEKQEENWISWEEVQSIRNDLKKQVECITKKKEITDTEYQVLLDFVILSLYTDIQPRRNKDYAYMYCVKKWNDKMSQEKNYYDQSTQKFIFNTFKTAKTAGQQIIDIPMELQETLKSYLTYHPLATATALRKGEVPLLVHSDGEVLNQINGITRVLNRIFSANVGASMLRHIYLSAKYGGSIEERERDATAMAHSVSAQQYYIQK